MFVNLSFVYSKLGQADVSFLYLDIYFIRLRPLYNMLTYFTYLCLLVLNLSIKRDLDNIRD